MVAAATTTVRVEGKKEHACQAATLCEPGIIGKKEREPVYLGLLTNSPVSQSVACPKRRPVLLSKLLQCLPAPRARVVDTPAPDMVFSFFLSPLAPFSPSLRSSVVTIVAVRIELARLCDSISIRSLVQLSTKRVPAECRFLLPLCCLFQLPYSIY